ncbi:hypothetical protein Tco_0354760, partial [Tanacetum coccineum]
MFSGYGCKIFESPWGSPVLVGDEDGDVKLFRMGMGEDIGMKSGNRDGDGDGDGGGDRDEEWERGWGLEI